MRLRTICIVALLLVGWGCAPHRYHIVKQRGVVVEHEGVAIEERTLWEEWHRDKPEGWPTWRTSP